MAIDPLPVFRVAALLSREFSEIKLFKGLFIQIKNLPSLDGQSISEVSKRKGAFLRQSAEAEMQLTPNHKFNDQVQLQLLATGIMQNAMYTYRGGIIMQCWLSK
jgi:hypothetical protein